MDFCKSCEELHAVSRIPLTIVHQEGEVRLALPAGHEELIPHRALTWVLADFVLQKRDALHPLVTYVEPGYFIGVVALPDDCYCIAGLVSPFQHARSEIMQMASLAFAPQQMQAYCDLMVQMPLVNLYQLKSLLCLVVQLAHGTEISAENILFVDNTVLRTEKPDDALFNLREDAEFHVPADFETGVCEAIEQGSTELLQHRLLQPSQGKVGAMSSNPLQQQKYAFISFATLLTRAAIRGGLPEETAFNLSDVYCQRADAQLEITTIQKLTYTMAVDFCRRVADTKNSGAQSPAVKSCINYISEHLHDDLRVEELSRRRSLQPQPVHKIQGGAGYGHSRIHPPRKAARGAVSSGLHRLHPCRNRRIFELSDPELFHPDFQKIPRLHPAAVPQQITWNAVRGSGI